jgi:hypothetical protein
MMDSTDMSTPVTRGELQDALGLFQRELKQELTLERQQELQAAIAPLATKAELQAAIAPLATKAELQAAIAPLATKAELQTAIAPLATRTELDLWGGALVARMQHGEQRIGDLERGQDRLVARFDQFEQRFSDRLQQLEERWLAELARHTSAIHEAMRTEIKACFEPLADLPGRMTRVEAAVFGPPPGARRTRRKRH